jgi:hypothetical protein
MRDRNGRTHKQPWCECQGGSSVPVHAPRRQQLIQCFKCDAGRGDRWACKREWERNMRLRWFNRGQPKKRMVDISCERVSRKFKEHTLDGYCSVFSLFFGYCNQTTSSRVMIIRKSDTQQKTEQPQKKQKTNHLMMLMSDRCGIVPSVLTNEWRPLDCPHAHNLMGG